MPTATVSLHTSADYAFRASAAGLDTLPLHGQGDLACTSPKFLELRGVGSILLHRLAEDASPTGPDYADGWGYLQGFRSPATRTVYISVRCRKCPACLDHKRRLWTARSICETRVATRTWFGTMTVAPVHRFRFKAMAERTVQRSRNERFSSLTPSERTKAIASELLPEVTKWLKRVRKQSAARFRYLLVVEAHADGFPHLHLLLHEQGQPVTKACLDGQWKLGFTQFRLIDQGDVRAVGYVCKYLSKSPQTRIRASRAYGKPDLGLLTERLQSILSATRGTGEARHAVMNSLSNNSGSSGPTFASGEENVTEGTRCHSEG